MDTDHGTLTAVGQPLWLTPWLGWLDLALHREILRLRARYELSMDELRGLYVSDEQVDRLVRRTLPDPELWERLAELDDQRRTLLHEAYAGVSPLRDLADDFGLDNTALLAIVVCLAPETDLSYQTIYAYLNDDVSRRLPTVDLCARIGDGRRLEVDHPVLREELLEVHAVEAAPLWRSAGLTLAQPVRRFLLDGQGPVGERLDKARLVLLEARCDEDAIAVAASVTRDQADVLVRPRDLPGASLDVRLREAVLTTRLQHATLLVTAADLGLGEGPPAGVTLDLCRLLARSPIRSILALRPGQGSALPLDGTDRERITVERPGVQRRTALWAEELSALGVAADREEVATVAAMFSLGPTQIRAAARAAAREGAPGLGELTRAARERSTSPLEGIAEWVPALYEWDDLVLPPATLRRVTELAGAVRHRHQVFDGWSFGRLSGGHASVRALFSGPSGTGKTMSASVVARDLGLDLYRIDLSAVVSKYVGETEKNLERVLAAAEESNAVLLFDEADALFGKRTEVKDAHDRYANIETAFLLQRLESFDGVVILATNLAGNLDDAFSRRIHFHVEFPMPDQALRADLWRKALPKTAPVDGDVDPEFLAGMFPLSGGDIRSATLTAAFMAAGEGGPIGMRQLVKALARHRRQQGKVPSVAEFRQYLRVACDEDG